MVGTMGGSDDLGIGVTFTLHDQFTRNASKIQGGYKSLSTSIDNVSQKINSSFAGIMSGVGLVATGVGLLAPIFKSLKIAETFQNYEIRLTTLLKSGDKARQLLADIKKDALENPMFATSSLLEASALMVGTGKVSPEMARQMSNNLAEVLASQGGGDDELKRMSMNLQQIVNLGYAEGRDIKQFEFSKVPIGALIRDYLGVEKGTEALENQGVTFEVLAGALKHATEEGGMSYKALERAGKGIQGTLARLQESFDFFLLNIGNIAKEKYIMFLGYINKIIDAINDFTNTAIGGWVVKASMMGVIAIGVGVILVGLTMIFIALASAIKTAIIALSVVFIKVLLPISLFVGAIYGMYRLLNSGKPILLAFGIAVMSAFGIFGVLVGSVILLIRSWKDFNQVMNGSTGKLEGVFGLLQQIGGVLQGVVAVFSSANSKGFSMTEGLRDALKKVGVLDFVISIGTWAVRIKEFFKGIKSGAIEFFNDIKDYGKSLLTYWMPVIDFFVDWDTLIGKNKSSLQGWVDKGKYAGKIILGVLTGIAVVGAVVFGVIASIPVIIAGVVAGIGWLTIKLTTLTLSFVDIIIGSIKEIGSFLYEVWGDFTRLMGNIWRILSTIGIQSYNIGKEIVINLLEGLKSVWSTLAEWITERISAILTELSSPINYISSMVNAGIGYFTGEGGEEEKKSNINHIPFITKTDNINKLTEQQKIYIRNPEESSTPNNTNKIPQTLEIKLQLDSKTIEERIINLQKLSTARE